MSPAQKLALVVFAVAIILLVAGILALRWIANLGTIAGDIDRDEADRADDASISTIKASLQEEAVTPNRHMSAKNYWSVP